jgi:hypothetical protein
MPCSIASRSCSSAAISRSSRPKVCRLSRRDRQRPGRLPGYRGGEEADRYFADQLAAAEDRGLADRLHAEGAVLDAHPRLAGAEGLARPEFGVREPDRLADQAGVGMGIPGARGVGHHDERRPGVAHGGHRHALHHPMRAGAARVTCQHRLLQAGLRGEGLCHGQGPVFVLLGQLPVQIPLHDGKADGQGDHQDRHHHDDDLGGQALPQQPPEGNFHGFLVAIRAVHGVFAGLFPKCNKVMPRY